MENLHINKSKILIEFIKTFLPPTGSRRKYSTNEIDYITSTLDRVFIQQFNFNLTKELVIEAFKTSSTYSIFEKMSPTQFNSYTNRIYIDVPAKAVGLLRKTTSKLAENTDTVKVKNVEELKNQIQKFKLGIR